MVEWLQDPETLLHCFDAPRAWLPLDKQRTLPKSCYIAAQGSDIKLWRSCFEANAFTTKYETNDFGSDSSK